MRQTMDFLEFADAAVCINLRGLQTGVAKLREWMRNGARRS